MNITQAEKFYEQDAENYNIEKNEEFLSWLNSLIRDGYHCRLSVEEIQKLIDKIVIWYEIKYPEREFRPLVDEDITFHDVKSISGEMDIKQLLFRLSRYQLRLLECGYRTNGYGQNPISRPDIDGVSKLLIPLKINRRKETQIDPFWEGSHFFIHADYMTGEVSIDQELEKYLGRKGKISLDELLTILDSKYNDELDFTEIIESVYDHRCDIELRRRVLQLVALKLLYSKDTYPERGYERAKRFISEFNGSFGLHLSTKQIDEIMQHDYSAKEDAVATETNISMEEPKKI